MAFLKETERTLRAYFIIVGALGVIAALLALSALFAQGSSGKHPPVPTSAVVPLAILFPALARLVLGSAFVMAGFGLKRALETGARWPLTLVKVAAAVVVVDVVLSAAVANTVAAPGRAAQLTGEAIGGAVIPLLLLWYIHSNVRRLANESRQAIVETVAGKFD
jgi:hypothetical protein